MTDTVFARTAQRLDAEYDGGNSDEGDDSDDDEDDSPMKLDTSSRCAIVPEWKMMIWEVAKIRRNG